MPDDARLAAYTIFGTLVVFKLVTGIWIFVLQPTVHSAAFLTMTNALWFGLVLLPVLIGGGYWYRVRRARARRAELIWAEWHVEEPVRPLGR